MVNLKAVVTSSYFPVLASISLTSTELFTEIQNVYPNSRFLTDMSPTLGLRSRSASKGSIPTALVQ